MNRRLALVKRRRYHYEMTVSRARSSERDAQKERTRAALVEAARGLLRDGAPPTVAEAAAEGRGSRPPAYPHFPPHHAPLPATGDISPATEPVEVLLGELRGDDAEARLHALLDLFNPIVFAEEVPMRTALRTYLD